MEDNKTVQNEGIEESKILQKRVCSILKAGVEAADTHSCCINQGIETAV